MAKSPFKFDFCSKSKIYLCLNVNIFIQPWVEKLSARLKHDTARTCFCKAWANDNTNVLDARVHYLHDENSILLPLCCQNPAHFYS